MKYVWLFATVACIYGAIAGSFLDNTPFSAIAWALLSIIFALAAWRDMSGKA